MRCNGSLIGGTNSAKKFAPVSRPNARRPHSRAAPLRIAARKSPGDDPGWSLPFKKRDIKSEEAARKALEGMFKGKKDILASLDVETGGGGGGGSKGTRKKRTGGGGDGGKWEMPDWRQFGRNLRNRVAGASKSVLAVTGFIVLFFAVPLLPQLLGFSLQLIKAILGLDGRARSAPRRPVGPPAQLAVEAGLGSTEASVIEKYGADEVFPEDFPEEDVSDYSEEES